MTNSLLPSSAQRSCLSVPASSSKMLTKAAGLPADQIVIDLEDAVAPSAKASARDAAAAFVGSGALAGRRVAVRVNALGTAWCEEDINTLLRVGGAGVHTLVMPKAESVNEVARFADLIAEAEAGFGLAHGSIGIEALIESARGVEAAGEIAQASKRVRGLIFGPADFAASIGLQVQVAGEQPFGWDGGDVYGYPMMRILIAARAAGIKAINGPYLGVRDLEGCRRFAHRAAVLGYDGMWALHPEQVTVVNDAFSPSPEEVERARALIKMYDAALSSDATGAILHDAAMVDEASRRQANAVLMRSAAAGVRPSTA